MSTIKEFADTAKGLAKNPLGIIALFIVLVYGFATLAVTVGKNIENQLTPLIYFLVLFPILVFIGFLWLVANHHDKIYGPSDFKDENNFLKMKMSAVASLAAATAKQSEEYKSKQLTQDQLDSIVDLVNRTTSYEKGGKNEKWKKKVLWVDDQPENNAYVRQAFESQGIEINIALSTHEALELLNNNKYAVIISDMGRKEGPNEGYVLLENIRKSGNQTPFYIYAGSNLPEHTAMAKAKGAQGNTNRPQELFSMVMDTISKC